MDANLFPVTTGSAARLASGGGKAHMSLAPQVRAVNIGCGITTAPGWINLDNSPGARLAKHHVLRWILWRFGIISNERYQVPWPRDIVIHDLTDRLPFADNSVHYVYASHVLEHLSLRDARALLFDIRRVLTSGGALRIVVPDLSYGTRRYLNALDNDADNWEAARELLDWLQLSKPGRRDPHLWMYDAPSLKHELAQVGFEQCTVCRYREGSLPDLDILDTRPTDSLHMEARKSGPSFDLAVSPSKAT